MKKTETRFYCDDCRNPLPENYITDSGKNELEFSLNEYNTICHPYRTRTDTALHIRVGLEVENPKGETYMELCPECRVKWLKIALAEFERQAQGHTDALGNAGA